MAGTHIKINTKRLNSDAQNIRACIKSIEKELSNMKNSVKEMNGMWEGESKKAFVKTFDADIKMAESFIKILEDVYEFEIKSKKKYEDCEKKVAIIVDSIRV